MRSQVNQVRSLRSHLCKIHLNIILPCRPTHSSCKWSLSFVFFHQNPLCVFLLPYMYHVSPTLSALVWSPENLVRSPDLYVYLFIVAVVVLLQSRWTEQMLCSASIITPCFSQNIHWTENTNKCGTGTGFSPSTSIFSPKFHSTGASLRGKAEKTNDHLSLYLHYRVAQ